MVALAQLAFLARQKRIEMIMSRLIIEHKQAHFRRLKGGDYSLRNQLRRLIQIELLAAQLIKALHKFMITHVLAKKQTLYHEARKLPDQGSKQSHCNGNKEHAS